MAMRTFFLFSLLVVCLPVLHAQSFLQRLTQRIDSSMQARMQADRPLLTPYVAPSFSPETSLLFSLGGLYSFSLKPGDESTLRSTLPFSAGYSINGSLLINLRNRVFGPEDRWRLDGEFWLRDMPDHFFGVGYREALEGERTTSTTQYHRFYWQILQRFSFRLGNRWYLGPAIHFNQTTASDLNPRMADDPVIRRQGSSHRNMGVGFSASLDTRDFPGNPYRGTLIAFTYFNFLPFLGSQNDYSSLELDYRGYLPVRREGRTLAWQVRTRMVTGAPPWPEYSLLGSPFDLRGYYWGRFRDQLMIYGILEYRHMFRRRTPNAQGSRISNHGLVGWLAAGSLAPDWTSLRYLLPNAGIGYRFQVQPRSNLRVDIGFGRDEIAFYLNFNEAF